MTEDVEPDAWEIETSDESWHDSRNIDTTIKRHFTYVPAHERGEKEPLFAAETIQEQIHQRLQKAKDNPMLSEAELKEIQFHLNKLKEVFSSDE